MARWGQKSNSTTNSPKICRAPVSAQCTQGSAVETPVQFSRFGASWSFLCCRRFLSLLGRSLQNIYPKAKNPSPSSCIQTSINPTKLQKTTFTLVNYPRRIKNLEFLLCRAPKKRGTSTCCSIFSASTSASTDSCREACICGIP